MIYGKKMSEIIKKLREAESEQTNPVILQKTYSLPFQVKMYAILKWRNSLTIKFVYLRYYKTVVVWNSKEAKPEVDKNETKGENILQKEQNSDWWGGFSLSWDI